MHIKYTGSWYALTGNFTGQPWGAYVRLRTVIQNKGALLLGDYYKPQHLTLYTARIGVYAVLGRRLGQVEFPGDHSCGLVM